MEFDQHKKPETPGEPKESNKKKLKKRTPAHVPLPIESKKKVSLEKKKKPETAKVNLRKEKTEKPQQPAGHAAEKLRQIKPVAEESPVRAGEHPPEVSESSISLEKSKKPIQHEQAPEMTPPHNEREVPLHEEVEGEVFISDRLRQDEEHLTEAAVEEANEQDSSEDALAEERPAVKAEDVADDTKARKPKLRQNPQQQQQTQASSPTGVGGASAGAASSPFLTQWRNKNTSGASSQGPNTTPNSPNQPPTPPNLPPQNPNLQPFNPNLPPAPNVLPITSQPVSEQVRDRASERRHLVTGLVVGALIEHVRHKRREKRMTKAHNKEVKELKKEQDGANLLHQVEQNKQLREKTALEKTIARLEKAALPFAAVAANKTPEAVPKKSSPVEQLKAAPIKSAEEAKKEFEERARRAVEIAREPEEELEIPENHRVETSAWHAIEVDKKTGKAVEDASFGYGEAFHQEQHQEQLKKLPSADTDAVKEDASSPASGSAVSQQHNPLMLPKAPQYPELSSGQSRSEKARERGAELAHDAAHVLGKIQPIDGLLWVILGIIVLIIFKLL